MVLNKASIESRAGRVVPSLDQLIGSSEVSSWDLPRRDFGEDKHDRSEILSPKRMWDSSRDISARNRPGGCHVGIRIGSAHAKTDTPSSASQISRKLAPPP